MLMKRFLTISLFFLIVPGKSILTFAQTTSGESVITSDIGFSVVGAALKTFVDGKSFKDSFDRVTVGINSKPAVVLSYDYGLSDMWSIGMVASSQQLYGDLDYAYTLNNELREGVVPYTMRRNNISFSTKVHYGGNERVDFYSGLRVGMIFWGINIDTNDDRLDVLTKFTFTRPNFSFTALGGRAYLTDHIACHFEFNLGAPNLVGAGLSVKL